MLLNGSSLNVATLGGSAGGVIYAFCSMLSASSVYAEPSVTRYVEADVRTAAYVVSKVDQNHTIRAELSCICDVLATTPYQTFASASAIVSSGGTTVSADVTRFFVASVQGDSAVSAKASSETFGAVNSACSSAVSANASVTRYVTASVAGGSSVSVSCVRKAYGAASISAGASVTPNLVHVLKLTAAASGSSTLTAHAGYAFPSATVVASGANIFAYARLKHSATSAISAKASSVTAQYTYAAAGKSDVRGTALVTAWAVPIIGNGHFYTVADVSAEATYVHEAKAQAVSNVDLAATAVRIAGFDSQLKGSALFRVEASLNNIHDGFSNPEGIGSVGIRANGVVVSPAVVYADCEVTVTADATKVHNPTASAVCAANTIASVIYTYGADAQISADATVVAIPHLLWAGAGNASCGSEIEAYGAHFNNVSAQVIPNTAVIAVNAVVTRMAHSAATATANVASVAHNIIYPSSSVEAACSLSSAMVVKAAEQGSAQITGSSDVTALGGQVFFTFADVLAFSNSDVTAAVIGNAAARDPEERTMRRNPIDRTMRRSFVERVMKATRT